MATLKHSGMDVSLNDDDLAQQLKLNRDQLSQLISASALDGHVVGTVTD